MKVGIVTPYHQRHDTYLEQCIESVHSQIHPNCFHVLVGDGYKSDIVNGKDFLYHVHLSSNIGDYGDSPRSVGAVYAFAMGADAIAFLDSDNWFGPDHISSLLALHQKTKAEVLASYRYLTHLDGRPMGVCLDSDGKVFCDTNCLLFLKSAKEVATSWWTIPPTLHALGDRIIWDRIITGNLTYACSERPTTYYRTAFDFHYRQFGLAPPESAKTGQEIVALSPVIGKLNRRALQAAKRNARNRL